VSYSFDIFKIEPGGRVRWQGAQESFLTAQKHVHRIVLSSPGQYLILDLITGDKVVVGQTDSPYPIPQTRRNP
jgi:hypothetical protein